MGAAEKLYGNGYEDILINEMQAEDYCEMYKLWVNTPGMGLSDADSYENIQRFLLRNEGLSFVCRHEGRIIGTILCGHDGRRGYLYHVAVEEQFRGQGIGKRLVETSLRRLKEEGCTKCHLFVKSNNITGNAFWSKIGWQKRDDIYVYSDEV